MIVDPLTLANDALLREAEAWRNSLTAYIASGSTNLDFIEMQIVKGIADEQATGSGHQALALECGPQPVANLNLMVSPVHRMVADRACCLTLVPDPAGETATGSIL